MRGHLPSTCDDLARSHARSAAILPTSPRSVHTHPFFRPPRPTSSRVGPSSTQAGNSERHSRSLVPQQTLQVGAPQLARPAGRDQGCSSASRSRPCATTGAGCYLGGCPPSPVCGSTPGGFWGRRRALERPPPRGFGPVPALPLQRRFAAPPPTRHPLPASPASPAGRGVG